MPRAVTRRAACSIDFHVAVVVIQLDVFRCLLDRPFDQVRREVGVSVIIFAAAMLRYLETLAGQSSSGR
jgi:hypothetical protein